MIDDTALPRKGLASVGVATPPADASPKVLATAIKARWTCEQAHQQPREELGLDHFEGRS